MKRPRTGRTLALFIAVAWLAPAHQTGVVAAPAEPRVVVRDGVRHVVNPGTPTKGEQKLVTTEVWRRGGADDDIVFGTIGDVTRDHRGNTYLLDVQTCEIRVVSVEGRLVRTLGRRGEGPGEFQDGNGVAILSDSLVCIVQSMPARIVRVTVDGRALGDHPLADDLVAAYLNGCVAVGNRLAVKLGQLVHGDTSIGMRTSFATLDPNGSLATTYWESLRKADFANMVFDEKADAEPVWAFGADGRLFVNNDWDRYEVEVIGIDGKPEHMIERAYEHRRRSPRDLEDIEKQKQRGDIHPDTKVSSTLRDVVKLFPRKDGSLWVLSSAGDTDRPEEVAATFDEFDRSGLFVRSVKVHGPRGPDDDFYIAGDAVVVVTGGENEVEAVCLRLASPR